MEGVHKNWDDAAKKDSEERAYFSQQSIDPNEVEGELREMEQVLGTGEDIQNFLANAIGLFNGSLSESRNGVYSLRPGDLTDRIANRMNKKDFPIKISFDGMPKEGAIHVGLSLIHI